MEGLTRAKQRASTYLASVQLPNGGFRSLSSSQINSFATATREYETTFFPSLILSALQGSGAPELEQVRQKLTAFLLAQKSKAWTWNYWNRNSNAYRKLPYPDDLDCSFCALASLHRQVPEALTGRTLAAVAKVLIACETTPGGPYKTWHTTSSATEWQDVDLVVNSNIAYFLQLEDIELPNIVTMTEAAIRRRRFTTPYYPSQFAVFYFVTRWYHGKSLALLRRHIMDSVRLPKKLSSLDISLAICSLLRAGVTPNVVTPLVKLLLRRQAQDGSWPAATFSLDPSVRGKVHYAGAASLTTAFCLEAIQLYEDARQIVEARPVPSPYQLVSERISKRVMTIEQTDLRREVQLLWKSMLAQDADKEIGLLPWLVAEAGQLTVGESILEQLAAANLWGWMAYTTYDNFFDEQATPKQLPAAIFCMRRLLVTLHETLPQNAAFQHTVSTILERMDAANSWELAHCRGKFEGQKLIIKQLPNYTDYWQLADRSLGHTIAALGVLHAAGKDIKASQIRAVETGLRHYLIARQLHDDAHDWQADLELGQINAVAVRVLRRWSRMNGRSLTEGIDLSKEAEQLQRIMWERIIVTVCAQVQEHCQATRSALTEAGFTTTLADRLLIRLERGAREALAEREQTLAFIKAF